MRHATPSCSAAAAAAAATGAAAAATAAAGAAAADLWAVLGSRSLESAAQHRSMTHIFHFIFCVNSHPLKIEKFLLRRCLC